MVDFSVIAGVFSVALSFLWKPIVLLLLLTFVAGMLQAVTKIEDETFSLAARIVGLFFCAVWFGEGLYRQMAEYAQALWASDLSYW